MPTLTTNYSLNKPLANDPTDQDLWGDYLNTNMDTIDAQLKTNADAITAIMAALHPVGSLYFNATSNVNPATLLGLAGTTWVAFAAGCVPIGVGTGTDGNGNTLTVTAGATGGEYNHVLTTPEIPAHTHTFLGPDSTTNSPQNTGGSAGPTFSTHTTDSTGGGLKHNNTQPYIGVYIWKRTA